MSEIVNILPYSIDLKKPLEKTELHTLFVMGDNEAHRFELEILRGSEKPDLTGSTVTGYFTNFKENTTIMVPGKVEDGKAVVVLSKPCYALHGQFVLLIQIKSGDPETTVFQGEGYMRMTKGETIIYDDYIVYDANALLAHISAMEAATKAANAAAGRAPYIGGNGNWYVWDAAKGAYADSGQKAQGPKGDQGDVTQEQFNQLSEQMVNYRTVENMVINPDFAIAQAGYNAYHGSEYYCADGWLGTNESVMLEKQDGYIRLTTSEDYKQIYQRFLVSDITAETYTFAVANRSESSRTSLYLYGINSAGEAKNIKSVSMPQSSEWQMGVLVFNRSEISGYKKIWICIRNQASGAIDYKKPVLYPGTYTAETLPPYVAPDPAMELAKCMQYYYPIPTNYSEFSYAGYTADNNVARITIPTPVPMFRTPSLFFPDGAVKMNVYTATTNASASMAQVDTAQSCGVALSVTASSTIPGWTMCTARFAASAALVADIE